MRYLRQAATSVLSALTLSATLASASAQTPLAIEKDPPLATQPVAPAPVLVPQANGLPIPAQPPVVPKPVVVPPGPAPVAVPEPPKPGPVFTPAVPQTQGSSAPIVKPQSQPETPKAPETVAPQPTEVAPVPPAVAAPSPAPAGEAAPPAPPAAVTAPAAPPVAAPETPSAPPAAAPAPSAPPAAEAPAPTPAPAYAVEEVTVEARPVLFVTGVTTWEKSEDEMSRVFAVLAKAATKLGIKEPAGPLVEYIESDSDDVGYRVMLPVATPPRAKLPKGVKLGTSPTGKALKFRHDGPIDDLEEVYGRIDDEVSKRGVDARVIVEEYDADALASPEDRVVVDVFVFIK